MDLFCHLCHVFIFVLLACLFLAALMVTCWERADLLAMFCVMFSGCFSCVFVTFQYVVLSQLCYLIV